MLCRVKHYGSYTPIGNGGWNTGDFKFDNLLVIDLTTKKSTVLKELGEDPEWSLGGFAWSPDGMKIAYVEYKRLPRPPGAQTDKNPFRVIVCDTDGKNAKEIYTAEGSWLIGFDWK